MPEPSPTPQRRGRLLRAAAALVVPLLGVTTAGADEPAARRALASQRQIALATPGDFTGYGFDQCVAPTQKAMDTWWRSSPFTAVGIYISGDSRACRVQPNLSPTWVAAQVARGWRLLPIAAGQARIASHRETAWASITFAGTRHRLELLFEGAQAVAAGEDFIAALPEHEFAIPRQLVADATVTEVDHRLDPPRLAVAVELLLLEDC